MSSRAVLVSLLICLATGAAGCGGGSEADVVPGADASRAPALVATYGCGACHSIPGIRGADATVGPPLAHLAERRTIAGRLPNDVRSLIRWLRDPQAVSPGSVMPDMGVTENDARDLAAYLYSH